MVVDPSAMPHTLAALITNRLRQNMHQATVI
jgi:hypothetical protein